MASSASAATGGFPAALAEVFCVSMACRTAWRPPRSSCSATGICSGRRAASMALRCTVDVGATGRSPRAGRPSPSPGRPAPGRRGPPAPRGGRSPPRSSRRPSPSGPRRPLPRRSPRSPRSPSSSRSRRRLSDPGAKMTDTSGARFGVPLTSMRPSVFSGERAGFADDKREDLDALEADFDVGPQAPHRQSLRAGRERLRRCPWAGVRRRRARSMTRRPSGSSTQCQSGVTCGGHATSPGRPCPMPGRDRHPVTWRRTSAGLREPPGRATHRDAVRPGHAPFRRIHMSEDTEQPGPEPAAGTPGEAAVPPRRSTTPERDSRLAGRATAAAQRRRMGVCATTRAGRQCPASTQPTHPPSRRRRELVLPTAATRLVGPTARSCDTGPTTAVTPTVVPFSYPPSGDATYPGPTPPGAGRADPGRCAPGCPWRSWPPWSEVASAPASRLWRTTTTTAAAPTSPSTRAAPRPAPPCSAAT